MIPPSSERISRELNLDESSWHNWSEFLSLIFSCLIIISRATTIRPRLPVAFCSSTPFSLSIYISFSTHLSTPRLCSILEKLPRGASLFWLPYFSDSNRPPCLPRFLPFYPFSSSLSPHPPFHKLRRPSLPSWPAYWGPSVFTLVTFSAPRALSQPVTLSLIQHVVPASETPPRSSSSPISATPGERYFSRSLVRICALISTCALPQEGWKLRVCVWPSFIDRPISTSSRGNTTAVVGVTEQRLVREIFPSMERCLGMPVRLRLPR